ncbi:MAG: hypothetical protein ACTSUE_17490 [Promethearchaeota archaeon]
MVDDDKKTVRKIRHFFEDVSEDLNSIAHVFRSDPYKFHRLMKKVEKKTDTDDVLVDRLHEIEEKLLLLSKVLKIKLDLNDLGKFMRKMTYRFRKPLKQTTVDEWLESV